MSKDELPGAGSSAKWAAIVDDRLIPLPRRQLKARDILHQAGADPESATLVRDFNSPMDIGFEPDAQVDLADGNVFRVVAGSCERRHVVTSESPKLAFIADDRWEVTIEPKQTAESLRGLLDISDGVELLRDFDSPIDEPIEEGGRVNFKDGPVFTTRKAQGREITIICRWVASFSTCPPACCEFSIET